jgi:hypothetical protein
MKDPRNEGEAFTAMAPREQRGYKFSGAMKPPPPPKPPAPPVAPRKGWLARRLDALFGNVFKGTP